MKNKIHYNYYFCDCRYAYSTESFVKDIEISATSIKYLEHVVVTLSLSLSLADYDNQYDYEDFDDHYTIGKNINFNFDFEDEDSGNTRSKRDEDYPWLTADHARRGDIKVEMVSPSGTTSVLLPYREFDFINTEGYDNWSFMSLHHWGENPLGTWRIMVSYKNSHAKVSVILHNVELYGTSEVPQAVSQIPENCDPACARGCAAAGDEYCDSCVDVRNYETLDCVSACPSNYAEYNHYCMIVVYHSEDKSPSYILPLVISAVTVILVALVIIIVAVVSFFLFKKYRKRRTGTSYHVVEVDSY